MNDAMIVFFGQPLNVICDRNCKKAWGINTRPRVSFDTDEPDDYAFYADHELGEAPDDPGTYEGGIGKPASPDEFPTKWCVRECERSAFGKPGQNITLPSFAERDYNMPWLHGDGRAYCDGWRRCAHFVNDDYANVDMAIVDGRRLCPDCAIEYAEDNDGQMHHASR